MRVTDRLAPVRDPDPRTFYVRISREELRLIPINRVLIPTLDGPVLVFRGTNQQWAELLKDDLNSIADLMRARGRSMPPKQRHGILARARRLHVQRVDLAVGYTWPRNPPGYIEFAET